MKSILKHLTLPLLLAAAMLATAGFAHAQSGQDANADSKAKKKTLMKFMSIKDGDTTVTEREIDPNDPEVRWVEKDDDGKEKNVRIMKDESGKEPKHSGMACCEKKESADKKECADKDCCAGEKHGDKAMHGKMGSEEMKEMHGKMGSDEMKEMHGKMSAKELKEMHKKMMKERKEKDDDEDEDADTDEADDEDDDDGMNLR